MELAQLVMDRSAGGGKAAGGGSSSSLIEGLIPFWLYIYPRLVLLEDDRRVREAIFSTVLPQLLAADRRLVMSHAPVLRGSLLARLMDTRR